MAKATECLKGVAVSRNINVHWLVYYSLDRLIAVTYSLSHQTKTHPSDWISYLTIPSL